MEDYRIDSHKLMFHPQRVADWMRGEMTYPINAEVGIAGACNHRCIFCAADHFGYVPTILSKEIALERFQEMHSKGLRSVLFAGTGEPLLNKDAPYIINGTKAMGVDVALSTNGVLLTEGVARECMESISWIRFSTSAGTEETYQKIHRGQDGDLERVLTNIAQAVDLKRRNRWNTVLGIQIVMIPENEGEVVTLAKKAKELGVDWFSVKSVGWLPLCESKLKGEIDQATYYEGHEDIARKLQELSDENFQAVYRSNRMGKAKAKRLYTECHAMPFHVSIDASGDVWPCCVMTGMERMCFGNIKEQTFEAVWHGERRKEVMQRIKDMGLSECIPDCRLDDMNRYLHELRYPNAHVNFI